MIVHDRELFFPSLSAKKNMHKVLLINELAGLYGLKVGQVPDMRIVRITPLYQPDIFCLARNV